MKNIRDRFPETSVCKRSHKTIEVILPDRNNNCQLQVANEVFVQKNSLLGSFSVNKLFFVNKLFIPFLNGFCLHRVKKRVVQKMNSRL